MPPLQLVTAGEDLRVWRLDSGSGDGLSSPTAPIVTSRPHKGGVTAVSFNHNNSVLVSSGVDGLLSLQYANGAHLFTLPASASPSLPPLSCLSLTSGSRYVVCGGQSRRLTVWDLKRQTVNRHLDGHKEEITCCDLLSSSSASSSPLLVASGSTSSAVLVHSLESGQTRCSLSLPSLHPVRALHFSPHRASVLAAGGDDGQPCLFDINTSSLLPSLSSSSHSHLASITAVLFSPSHPSLLLSCSLASTLHYHDTASSQLIQSVHCAAAVTSADWCDDGHHIAVGCSDGSVLLYDVRKEGAEVASFRAHDGEVRSLRFQRLGKAAAGGAAAAAGSAKAKETPASVVDSRSSVFIPSTPQLAAVDAKEQSASASSVTPATVKAVSRGGRAAPVADGAAGDAETDGHYAPVTPYVPHTKPFNAASSSSSLLREAAAPAATASSAAAFPSTIAGAASSSSSLLSSTSPSSPPLRPRGSALSHVPVLPANGSAAPSASLLSSQPSSTVSPPSSRPQLPSTFADRHTPSSSTSVSSASAKQAVSSRRSSFPAPAPFSSSILPASSSASSSRRNTLDKLLQAHSLPVAPVDGEDEGGQRLVAAVDAAVERRLGSLYEEMRNDLQLLQLDMFNQFHSQSQQLTACVDSLQQQNQLMRDELQQLRAALRQHQQ